MTNHCTKNTEKKQHHLQSVQTTLIAQNVSTQPEALMELSGTQMMQDKKDQPMLQYTPKRTKLYFKGKTLKNIPPHTELFNDYGKEYWDAYAFPHKPKYYIAK